ncbi:EAL domain-containing protein [Synechococcus elongatus IITB7]|uniref:EAL domain-containing protein n=1 Tax=Synechococcus elongatus TaxID=32046 RepID=UPI0030CA68FF
MIARPMVPITDQFATDDLGLADRSRFWLAALEATGQGVAIADANHPDLILTYVNSAFKKLTGYNAAEALGKSCRFLQGSDRAQPGIATLRQAIQSGKSCEVVLRNYRKDGSLFWNQLAIAPMTDSQGKVSHYVALQRDITALKEQEQAIQRQGIYDDRTTLPKRQLFLDRLNQALAWSQFSGIPGALLLVDLGTPTHLDGSPVLSPEAEENLEVIANRLQAYVRPHETLAHLSHYQFGLLLLDPNVQLRAEERAHGIQAVIRDRLEGFEGGVHIGIVPFVTKTPATVLLQAAEAAAQKARSQQQSYLSLESSTVQEAPVQHSRDRDWQQAIDAGELTLALQPQMGLRNRQLRGFEVQLRWQHPQQGMLLASQLLDHLEESPHREAVGRWFLDQAGQLLSQWRTGAQFSGLFAIPLLPQQWQSPTFLSDLRTLLETYQIPPEQLELDVPAQGLADGSAESWAWIHEVRALGIGVSLADFGSRTVGLYDLRDLPLTTLKLERRFVRGLPDDANDRAIVRGVVAMSQALKVRIVARGVDTVEQAKFLARAECDAMQGLAYSAPLNIEEALQVARSPQAPAW